MNEIVQYNNLLKDIKERVRKAQLRASLSANAEMLATYWDVGRLIYHLQKQKGWGAGVIPRLSRDLKNELPGVKGFSERNMRSMVTFYKEYQDVTIWQPAVAKFHDKLDRQPLAAKLDIDENCPSAMIWAKNVEFKTNHFFSVTWTHHIILLEKIKDREVRFWYLQQIIENGWSKESLIDMIKKGIHLRQGKAATNFNLTLPPAQSALAKEMLKDPYIFDFTTLTTEYTERELETELVKNVEKFLIELGSGFAFVGRQFKLEISDRDFYLDLLFYHLKMRCFVVIDLKRGEFLPEYAGKMNFYCSAVDDLLKHPADQPTVGLILCQHKDQLFAEYTLKDIQKPIGISEYELTRILPENLKSSLPSVEEIEQELGEKLKTIKDEQ